MQINNQQENEYLYFEDQKKEDYPNDLSGAVESSNLKCSNCKRVGMSELKCDPNRWTCLYSLLLTPICLCFIPFVVNRCQDVYHRCPYCQIQIGYTEHNPC